MPREPPVTKTFFPARLKLGSGTMLVLVVLPANGIATAIEDSCLGYLRRLAFGGCCADWRVGRAVKQSDPDGSLHEGGIDQFEDWPRTQIAAQRLRTWRDPPRSRLAGAERRRPAAG